MRSERASFVSTSTYFLAGEAERLVVGKFVNLIELGCFSLALSLSTAGSRAIQQVLGQVFFPMMSDSIRQDPEAAFQALQENAASDTHHMCLHVFRIHCGQSLAGPHPAGAEVCRDRLDAAIAWCQGGLGRFRRCYCNHALRRGDLAICRNWEHLETGISRSRTLNRVWAVRISWCHVGARLRAAGKLHSHIGRAPRQMRSSVPR